MRSNILIHFTSGYSEIISLISLTMLSVDLILMGISRFRLLAPPQKAQLYIQPLDDVFSDVFGKSSRSIITQILEHPDETFDVAPFIHKLCKHPIEEIQAAVDGAICPEQATKLKICLDFIDEQKIRIDKLDTEIFRLAKPYSTTLDLIRTVPGLSREPLTAIRILSEIGADMSVFPTSKHLVSWAGCCPRNDSSAQKVKSTRISRAGSFLKPLLVQIANALIKSKNHPEFQERYRRIKARRGHKKAIIAICLCF